jgi:cytochrome c oxidase subunit 2
MSRILISMMLSGLVLLIATPKTFAEPNLERGKTKFQQICVQCHKETGSGSQEIGAPRIAGQLAAYEKRQLQNFRAGIRGAKPEDSKGALMKGIAMALAGDQEIVDVIAYFDTLTPEILPETVKGGNAAKGKDTYAICAACHGDDGKGIEVLSAPRVAGIPDWYLERQIRNFDTGVRGTHSDDVFGRQMGVIQKLMLENDQAILDVIAYINTLPKE